jgi:hypothetical protein
LGNSGNLRQGFLAQLGAKFGEFFALAVCELHAAANLVAHNTVLCGQIFIAKPQMVIGRLCYGF